MKKNFKNTKNMDKRQEIIINKISDLLQEYKWTQAFLAYNSGISEPTLTNIMNGYTKPSDNTIQKIADTFGVYKEYITGDIIYKNFESWNALFYESGITETQQKAFFDLLNCWGYEFLGIQNNLVTFRCPNGAIKVITITHLKHIIDNMIVTFNAVLIPQEYITTGTENGTKNDTKQK